MCNRRFVLKTSLVAMASLAFFPELSYASKSLPEGRLNLYNLHTEEKLAVRYRSSSGKYDSEALKDIKWILRCHHNGEMHEIDRELLEFVNLVSRKFGSQKEIQIISGYRSPEYNRMLVQGRRGVAGHSLHMEGKAIDIRITGVNLRTLRNEALGMELGGVGYYRRSRFVHLDSGRFRRW